MKGLYMSRSSWHVVSLTCSCQSSFCTASNELSVDKVFKYSQSPHISDAIADLRSASCDFIKFPLPPSLPPSSATLCRVGWSDSVPVAFAHVLEYCRHFVILSCSRCAGKFEKHARKVSHVYLICSKLGCLYERKRFTSIVRKAGEGTGSYHLHCTGFHQLPYTLPAASTTLVWGKLKFNTFSCTGLARTHRFDEFYTILFEVVCLDRLRWKYFYTKSC